MSSTPVPPGAPASPETPLTPEASSNLAQSPAAPEAEPLAEPSAAQATEPAGEAPAGQPAGQTAEPSAAQAQGQGQDAQACAAALKQLFPALFAGAPKPVKLRIQADIQERAPGRFTKPQLSAFLRRYTGSTGYLVALSKAKQRFDLDGQPAGELSDEHREAALQELTRRRGITQARRAEEDQARQQRAQLLRDFSRTTLTPANFCALKGIAPDQLEPMLALAREEEAQQPPRPPRDEQRRGPRPDAPRGERRGDGRGEARGGRDGRGQGAPRGDRNAGQGERRTDRAPRNEGSGQPSGGNSRDGRRPPRSPR